MVKDSLEIDIKKAPSFEGAFFMLLRILNS